MKYKWLNKENNNKLIIFFNGWGMDESIVKHLEFGCYDVIMFYDYNDLNIDLNIISGYDTKYLTAWSMGVMIASKFNIEYASKTAINGTLKPIDDKYGILPKIYDLTIKRLDVNKFMKQMFEQDENIPEINRNYENQRKELEAIKTYSANLDFKYNKVIISSNDKIIPTSAQVRFWNITPNIEAGHCPFYHYKTWGELL